MSFGKRLKFLREERGISQSELARITEKIASENEEMTRTTQASIARWEANENSPSIDNLLLLAKALRVNIIDLVDIDNGEIINSEEMIRIAVLGFIPAGYGFEAIENVIDYVEIPKSWTLGGKEYFALKITGDSMIPKYQSDDVVIFLKTKDCKLGNGKDCAVFVNDDDATFKKFIINDNGVILQAYNSEFGIKSYTKDEVEKLPITICGVGVEVRRKINE